MPDIPTNSPASPKLGILYSFRRCPYAIRARLACTLFLPPQSLELREVVLKNKPQELLDVSPKATVPVLLASRAPSSGESLTGGAGTDTATFLDATTVDFTTGTLATIETLTGSDDDDE